MTSTTALRVRRLPPWPKGPKPKRRTELGMLIFVSMLTSACYVLASLGATSKIPPHIGPFLALTIGLTLVAHMANRWLAPNAHPALLPVVALLNGLGYVIISSLDPAAAKLQAGWTALGIAMYVATLLVIRRSRDLDRYRYILLLVSAALLLAPLVPGIGLDIYGARLWIHLGSFQFQPIEIAKITLCIFFASYFAENKEMLSIPTARMGNRLVLDPRPLLPILLAWGFAMLVIGAENDIGFALLIFVLFIGLLWISTGRSGYLVVGLVLFGVGAYMASHLFAQVHGRVSVWLNPWPTVVGGAGQQLGYGWFALGGGGVGGTGLGVFHVSATGILPENTTDMIFASLGEQLGLMGTSVVVFSFMLLVGSGLRIAQTARSDFSRLVATGLTLILGFQAFFIMAGVLRLLPLTGITLPFVAYGGSSLIANYVLLALLLRISDEGATPTAAERNRSDPWRASIGV